ncbi:MAG TPA: POTRA domain-containing protein [Woeseiaceae bacterium]|nr:POTRA domain-containing protein [Woeseiaceae bacterium]
MRVAFALIATVVCVPVFAQSTSTPEDPLTAPGDNAAIFPEPAELEAQGAIIGRIILRKGNVFDTSRPDEDKALYRLANRWHVLTRDSVIRQQLLFREGDRYSARLVAESARLLRRNGYLYTADVMPIHYEDGVVDIEVRTRDLWTLMPAMSISRSGGENKSRVSVSETNLLGRGARLRFAYEDDVDRESKSIEFSDNNLAHSWASLYLGFSDKSDGNTSRVRLVRPFFALDSRWTAGFDYLDDTREDRLYDLGEEVAEYQHESDYFTVFGGWSAGLQGDMVRRWTAGVVYDNQRFGEVPEPTLPNVFPEDRRLLYPFIGFELLEDRYETTSNRDQIGRTEDFYLGRSITARLGFASDSMGSDRDSIIYSIDASRGFGTIRRKALILAAGASGRIDEGESRNAEVDVAARYYNQISDKRLFFTTIEARFGHDLDLDNPIELGGDSGLRGYPLRYQSGDKSLLFTIEQRYFTDWYPFRLVRIGGAVFADVGRTWGSNPVGSPSLGWLKDVGFGLRLGPTRGGSDKVIHIDIAFPLDGDATIDDVQVLLESKASF